MSIGQAEALATQALTASGAGEGQARAVARAVVAAHASGRSNVGLAHLPYYCNALRRGALDGRVEPIIEQARPGLLTTDARSGFTHYAFDRAFEQFAGMVESQGVAVLTIRNTYTCGCLGFFPERLARRGFAALAVTNAGPAVVAPSGASAPGFSTNPIAFALPRDRRPPLLIDQSTSACTLVDVHAARERGDTIPTDWALDREGNPTTNPDEALEGTFKPFGGYKGANIALMVELLAAGLSGGNWSIDAPSFADHPDCPDVGQWFLAMDLAAMDHPGRRIDEYLDRLASMGAYIPGQDRQAHFDNAAARGITIPDDLFESIQSLCGTT
ncbi:MAG: Ldh family oxidoreductase [Gammaproteobacteria bacterium]|nr:Ldh family oxidoreductase [Gammaproteobacteria bacterium]